MVSLEGIRAFMLPEDAPRLEQLLTEWQALPDGVVREEEHRLRHADGSARHFAGRELVLARRPDRTARLVMGMLSDITPRKRVELALRDSEAKLNQAQALAHIGSWYLDLKNGLLTWSAETYRISGIARAPTSPTGRFWPVCPSKIAIEWHRPGRLRCAAPSTQLSIASW